MTAYQDHSGIEYTFIAEGSYPDTAANPTAADLDKQYVWTTTQGKVYIKNRSTNYGNTMRIKWNGTTACTDTTANEVLEPGEATWSPKGMGITTVEILFTLECTVGTDFVIVGWE